MFQTGESMKKTVNICDRCGRECPYESIYATVGAEARAVSVDTVATKDVIEDVDLCPLCMRARMDQMVQEMTPAQRAEWVEASRKKLEVRR